MDDFERRVLKRKRHDLMQHLTADDKYIHYLRRHDVIDIEEVVDVLVSVALSSSDALSVDLPGV
jgi:hypothetical protein